MRVQQTQSKSGRGKGVCEVSLLSRMASSFVAGVSDSG